MQVTVEDVSAVKKILHIEVPHADVQREVEAAYKQLKKTAKIRGFRQGKAPREVLERYFKKDVHGDIISKLIQESFVAALKETDLDIVGQPAIDPPGLDEQGPYKYNATVEIKPDIGNIDFKGLTLKKPLYKVTDEELDAQLKQLQKALTKQEPVAENRPVGEGDFVLVDYEGFQNGKPFEETYRTENFTMKIGDGQISKALDDQMIGMQMGTTRDIDVSFAPDHFNPKLAGQKITFKVELKQIREQKIPAIDDSLAQELGPYQTLDDLKKAITDNLNQGYAKRIEQELNEQIFQALIDKVEFEVPEAMVQYELEGIIEDAEKSFAYHNTSLEAAGLTREMLAEKYRGTAEKQVRRHLILSRIIEQENLTLADEDLQKGFSDMAATVNQPVDQIRNFYMQNKEKLAVFKHALLEKDAIKLIIECSAVEDVEPELVRPGKDQTAQNG